MREGRDCSSVISQNRPQLLIPALATTTSDRPPSSADPDLVAALGDIVEPEDCAACALDALEAAHSLALPHPRVGESFALNANDYDAWLSRTTQRLRRTRDR